MYGVATFYSHFLLKPPGLHTCVICTGTACYIKGASALLVAISRGNGCGAGSTTPDGTHTLNQRAEFMIGATMIESAERGAVSVRSAIELLSAAYALHPALGG